MKRNVKWIFLAAIAVISIGAYAAVLLKPVEAQAGREGELRESVYSLGLHPSGIRNGA